MNKLLLASLATAVLAIVVMLTGRNPVTSGPGGWVNGFHPSPAATTPAPADPGNSCPGGNGYETWRHTWNCNGKIVK